MTKIEIDPCKLRYSLVHGVYVVMLRDEFNCICQSFDLLKEWLDTCSHNDAEKVRIFLAAVDDWDKDEVTHLVFSELQGDYKEYGPWAEWHGPSAFMEFWFDEWDPRTHGADWMKRYRRQKEIEAPTRLVPVSTPSLIAAE